MQRIDKIIAHPLFRMATEKIQVYEQNREFCCHGMSHSLDVARIAYIRNLEQKMGFSKELIYAAALLHDLGRWKQYEENMPHERAGVLLAEEILKETGFDPEETTKILKAIGTHRNSQSHPEADLGKLLYQADKQSRVCWLCKAQENCYWTEEQKNKTIRD